MAFDVELRDNGAGTFDVALSGGAPTPTEKSIPFIGDITFCLESSASEVYVAFVDS
jgi:hypothetical protein